MHRNFLGFCEAFCSGKGWRIHCFQKAQWVLVLVLETRLIITKIQESSSQCFLHFQTSASLQGSDFTIVLVLKLDIRRLDVVKRTNAWSDFKIDPSASFSDAFELRSACSLNIERGMMGEAFVWCIGTYTVRFGHVYWREENQGMATSVPLCGKAVGFRIRLSEACVILGFTLRFWQLLTLESRTGQSRARNYK